MLQIKNVLIRNLTDDDREAIQTAIRETGYKQASKAMLAVCKGYSRMVKLYKETIEERNRLKKENEKLKKSIKIILSIQDELQQCVNEDKEVL